MYCMSYETINIRYGKRRKTEAEAKPKPQAADLAAAAARIQF
jgi:hypothetical protein